MVTVITAFVDETALAATAMFNAASEIRGKTEIASSATHQLEREAGAWLTT